MTTKTSKFTNASLHKELEGLRKLVLSLQEKITTHETRLTKSQDRLSDVTDQVVVLKSNFEDTKKRVAADVTKLVERIEP